MHEIRITTTVADQSTTTVLPYEFGSQEEAIEFLEDYILVELGNLYDELRKLGDRTTALVEPASHRSMRRTVTGTSRKDGRSPITGTTTVSVTRVA